MKNIFRKTYKSVLALGITIFFVLSMFVPMFGVRADTVVGSGSNCITGSVRVHPDFSGNFTITSATIDGSNINNNTSYCTDGNKHRFEIVVNALSDQEPEVQWGGNWNDKTEVISITDDQAGNYTFIIDFTTQNNDSVNLDVVNYQQPGSGEPNESNFDGHAFLLWSCESGGICVSEFTDIPNFDDGNSKFYKDTDIIDARTGEHFNIKAQYKGWTLPDKLNDWVSAYKIYKGVTGDLNPATIDPKDMLGDPIDVRPYEKEAEDSGACTKEGKVQEEFQACVNNYAATKGVWVARAQLQPVGEPTDNNAYVSYGDRNFKVVIYNDSYKGVTLGSLNGLNYYPASWTNPFTRQDQFDISGTTKDKPTYINTVLLESTVKIKELSENGYQITKIEALDVPKDAISINKINGEWNLVFSSNFYDEVVFKATDSNGEASYFAVKRYTVDAWINNVEGVPHLYAEMYFDRNKSYSDFVLTAKIIYKDGTTENVKLKNYNKIDDGLGNITVAEEIDESISPDPEHQPAGKGLKKSVFIYKLPNGKTDRDIKKAYVNIEYKGSTSTKYAGSFAGSGEGVLANIYQGEEE